MGVGVRRVLVRRDPDAHQPESRSAPGGSHEPPRPRPPGRPPLPDHQGLTDQAGSPGRSAVCGPSSPRRGGCRRGHSSSSFRPTKRPLLVELDLTTSPGGNKPRVRRANCPAVGAPAKPDVPGERCPGRNPRSAGPSCGLPPPLGHVGPGRHSTVFGRQSGPSNRGVPLPGSENRAVQVQTGGSNPAGPLPRPVPHGHPSGSRAPRLPVSGTVGILTARNRWRSSMSRSQSEATWPHRREVVLPTGGPRLVPMLPRSTTGPPARCEMQAAANDGGKLRRLGHPPRGGPPADQHGDHRGLPLQRRSPISRRTEVRPDSSQFAAARPR